MHELFTRPPIQALRSIVKKYMKARIVIATTVLNVAYMYGADAAGGIGEKLASQTNIAKAIDAKLLTALVVMSYVSWIMGMVKSSNENYKSVKNGEPGLSILGVVLHKKVKKTHPDNEKLQKLAVQMGQMLPEFGKEFIFIGAAILVSQGINAETAGMLIAANILAGNFERGVALTLYLRRTLKQLRAEGMTSAEIGQFLTTDLKIGIQERYSNKIRVVKHVIETIQQPEFRAMVLNEIVAPSIDDERFE